MNYLTNAPATDAVTTETVTTETLVSYGGAIKMLADDGDTMRIGGYLVLFGSPDETDISAHRDYFTKSTDFDIEDGATSAVYYHHGLNPTLKARKLGTATLSILDAGVWMEAELKARDDYERNIQKMVRAGKLGLSSGTAAHLVERKAVGEAHHILRWPLGLDVSLTPTPANPRSEAIALKSLMAASQRQPMDLFDAMSFAASFTPTADNNDYKATNSFTTNDILSGAESLPVGLSFADHSARVLAANAEYLERAKSIIDLRCIKAGRVLSQANCDRIQQMVDSLQPILDEMRALLAAHKPGAAEETAMKSLNAEIDELEIAFLAQEMKLTEMRLEGQP